MTKINLTQFTSSTFVEILDNNDIFTPSSTKALVMEAIDKESMNSLSKKGAQRIDNFFDPKFDPKKALETISFQVKCLISDTRTHQLEIHFCNKGNTFQISSSTGESCYLPRALLRINKFGECADLLRASLMFILRCMRISFRNNSKEKAFKRFNKSL